MNQFSLNLSTVFTELPFLKRFKSAKAAGFSYVECQFPYQEPTEKIKDELDENQLSLVLINLPPGNWEEGDRGLAIDPSRRDLFKSSVTEGIRYAKGLNCPNIHCMAGVLSSDLSKHEARRTFIENIKYAAAALSENDLTLLIEPINFFDMPGYFLSDLHEAAKILDELHMENVKLQFDFYHMQRLHGNLLTNFERYIDHIGHVQIADVPGRHEPGTGEINYQYILRFLEKTSYTGLIGLEYTPKTTSERSFDWLQKGG
jgi:hydroxypyruvate isomerase